MKAKKEQLDRLTRGKRSGISLGSRMVGHRLTQSERAAFERAKKMYFIVIDDSQRANVRNVWEKYCEIMNLSELILVRERAGSARVMCGSRLLFSGTLTEAKAFVAGQSRSASKN